MLACWCEVTWLEPQLLCSFSRSSIHGLDGNSREVISGLVEAMVAGDQIRHFDELWALFRRSGITNPVVVAEQISILLLNRLIEAGALSGGATSGSQAASQAAMDGTEPGRDQPRSVRSVREDILSRVSGHGAAAAADFARAVYPHFRNAVLELDDAKLPRAIELTALLLPDGQRPDVWIMRSLLHRLQNESSSGIVVTPNWVVQLLVRLLEPRPGMRIADPASGACSYFAGIVDSWQSDDLFGSSAQRGSLHFWGCETNEHLLRIGCVRLLFCGADSFDLQHRDALSASLHDENRRPREYPFDRVFCTPPFKSSVSHYDIDTQLTRDVKTRSAELLYLLRIFRMLESGGRAAVVLSDSALLSNVTANKEVRRQLLETVRLEAVISFPDTTFKPATKITTSALIFSAGGYTDHVWFCDLGAIAKENKSTESQASERVAEMFFRGGLTDTGDRTGAAFRVSKVEIAECGWDLSISRYRQQPDESPRESPAQILQRIEELEVRIQSSLQLIRKML